MDMFDIVSVHELVLVFQKYRTYIIAGVLAVGLSVGGGIYYYVNHAHREQAAQEAFVEMLTEMQQGYRTVDQWYELELETHTALQQFKSSSMVPYFLLLQAEALIGQQKYDEAIQTHERALSALSQSSPFSSLYAIKNALVRLSLTDEAQKEKGIQELRSIADRANEYAPNALYALANYYQTHNEVEKARELWQQLAKYADTDIKNEESESLWAVVANYHLQKGV